MTDTTEAPAALAERRARTLYDLGPSTIYAARSDPRFSYCTYVPEHVGQPGTRPMQLVVVVHGTGRAFVNYREAFSGFAKWNDCIVLCPLFPAGVRGDGNRDGFKHLIEADIRYDQVLLDMVAEVGEKFGCDFGRFALFGYSGGGQFGAYLSASNGMTLYQSTKDSTNVSNCTGACATAWPPYIVSAAVAAAPTTDPGITGKIGTITRADGSLQLTYRGLPLYFFAGDVKPGDTTGEAVNGFTEVAP